MQNSSKDIEKILQQLDSHTESQNGKASIDDDVDEILASLGISKGKTKDNTATTAQQTPSANMQQRQQTAVQQPGVKNITTEAHNSTDPEVDEKVKVYTASKKESELQEKPKVRIIDSAPLSAPLIQSETETLELPTIKAYSEMQAKRLAEIERVAIEKAMTRAKEGKNKDAYNLPGMKYRSDALRVDVDDHFRDFFSNSVANVHSEYVPDNNENKAEPEKKKGKRKKGSKVPSARNISVVASSQGKAEQEEEYIEPVGAHGTLTGFSVLSQSTGTFGSPLSEENKLKQQVASAQKSVPSGKQPAEQAQLQNPTAGKQQAMQKPQQSAQNIVQTGAKVVKQNVSAVNATPLVNNNISDVAEEHYTDSIVKQNDISDTFMQNRIDFAEEENAPEVSNSSEVAPKAKSDISQMIENLGPEKNDFWGEGNNSGAVFKEITVNMPITRTSTIGIDPDTYGVPADDYDEHHDYNHISDAPTVTGDLKNIRLSRLISMVVSGAVFLFLLLLNIISSNNTVAFLAVLMSPSVFIITNLALTLMLGAVCVQTLKAGFLGILGRPSTDTLVLFAFLGAIIQCTAYLIIPDSFNIEGVNIFAPLAAFLFFTSNLGKFLQAKSVIKNFKITSTGEEHHAAFIVNGRDLTKMVCSGLSEPAPVLLVSRPTSLVKGFVRQSFSSHKSDVYARKISLILIMAAITCTIITSVLTRDVVQAASSFAAVLCIGAPITSTLVYAVPFMFLQRNSAKAGVVIPGAGAIQSLGYCNTVLLRSEDLFPAQNVKLNGIKPFAGRRIDTAILFAASIVYYNCPTLRGTFMALIDNKKSVLLPVKNSETVAGLGFVANVDGQHVVFGNRAMMRRHNIEIPSLEYENHFTKNGKFSVIYLALNHRPYSIYILGYEPNKKAKKSLDSLIQAGFSVVVQSDDFNITSQKASTIYSLPSGSVKVLSQSEQDMLAGQTDYMPESEGYMTHGGNCHSFISGLKAAADTAHKEKSANTVQIAAVIVTVIILLALCVLGALSALSLTVIVLYQIIWGIIAIIPCFMNNS